YREPRDCLALSVAIDPVDAWVSRQTHWHRPTSLPLVDEERSGGALSILLLLLWGRFGKISEACASSFDRRIFRLAAAQSGKDNRTLIRGIAMSTLEEREIVHTQSHRSPVASLSVLPRETRVPPDIYILFLGCRMRKCAAG